MPKRKSQAGDGLDDDLSVPLPIQTFFWRQTSPFIRPKLGKLCDASCISFERVVVQNILHGQPPSLCEAIQSVSRWKVIQVAFPHVIHACAALLENRMQYQPGGKFTNSETKLLYTLHWIILDAASECEDNATLSDTKKLVPSIFLHPLKTVQLFVYMFAPLVNTLAEPDFQSLKLENGLRLWQPLWDYHQPDVPCFSTPVKPQRNVLKAQRNQLKVNTNAANIYIGKGTSTENLRFVSPFDDESIHSSENDASPTRLAPLARLSDSEFAFMSQSETQSVLSVCQFCNNVKSGRANEGPSVCRCGRKDSYVDVKPERLSSLLEKLGSLDKDLMKNRLASAAVSGIKGDTAVDILSASYFDVAVLQCLFCLQWSVDGVYWALKYVHQRLLEISDEVLHRDMKDRERSRSLPFADPNLLGSNGDPFPVQTKIKQTKDRSIQRSASNQSQRFVSQSPGLSTIQSESEPAPLLAKSFAMELHKEPPFKKVCMVELRQFPDSKNVIVTRKHSHEGDSLAARVPFKSKLDNFPPPKLHREYATSYIWKHPQEQGCADISPKAFGEKLKSPKQNNCGWDPDTTFSGHKFGLPASPDHDSEVSSQHSSIDTSSLSQAGDLSHGLTGLKVALPEYPIITITQDTPQRTQPIWPRLPELSKSVDLEPEGNVGGLDPGVGLARSLTDSNISYLPEEDVHEVAGAVHYIQKNGHINYKVILQAIHFVTKNHSNEKICEVSLNLLNCLFDLDIIDKKRDTEVVAESDKKSNEMDEQSVTDSSGKTEITAFDLAMDCIFSTYKSLGCPYGCGDGLRSHHSDMLRQKGHNCLQRLQKMNPTMFRNYMKEAIKSRPIQEIVDFFHAFLGFCVEPALIRQASQTAKKTSAVSVSNLVTQASTSSAGNRKSVSQEAIPNNSGFVNNFGHNIGGVGYRGVEGVMVSNSMTALVTRCVESTKELYSSDNISLFCDIRQLITYFKEIHGGTFRRVALSGLLDAYFDLKEKAEQAKEIQTPVSHAASRTVSVTSDSGDEKDAQKTSTMNTSASDSKENGRSRKSIFKKKPKKMMLHQPYAASDSEILEDIFNKSSPRASLSATEDDPPSGTITPRRKFSKFHIGWRKPKSDHEEDSPCEPGQGQLDRHESKSESHFHRHRIRGKMSFKTASQATLTFLSARRRIEGGLKSLTKKTAAKQEHSKENKQGHDGATEETEGDGFVMREKRLVDKFLIKSGMLRFNFLLECCHPGTIPDPQLVAAMIQLEAPVAARATFLLEVAHFVHRCNSGEWPNWMKLNLPSFRHSSSALQSRGQPSGYRRTINLQKAAGRMFYSWAENLGHQLEYMLAQEQKNLLSHVTDIHDEKKKCQLRQEDDEEDFLDENIVNSNGNDCPYALKMLACLVLHEITTFLRETFQYLPRKKHKLEPGWDKHLISRRYSSIISSPGQSDKSSESNIGELTQYPPGNGAMGSPGDRKISFAVQMERSDSLNSSQTSASLDPLASPHTPVEERKSRRLAQGRQKILKHVRRGSLHNTSFRQNRSFRLKRQDGGSIKHYGSIRSRKVSSQSIHSDTKFMEPEPSSDDIEESMTMFSDEQQEGNAEEQQEIEDERMYLNMPWIKVVIQLANMSNFICPHQGYCHPNCYERQRRSCYRLVTAVRKVYQSTEQDQLKETEKKLDQRKDVLLKEKFKRRESIFQQHSPTKRRESTPLLEKIKTDVTLVKQKLNNWKKENKSKVFKEDCPLVKYINSQVQKLTHCPLGILTKAAPILTEEQFMDIMPVAWELMMETDQEVSAAAACMFLISSVKAPEKAQTMVFKELQHEDPNVRINAIIRFGTLWKFRHQVWPRMEEGAQLHFKVPPPGVDFTLPSPTIGLPSHIPIDPPWIPHFKAKIEEVTVNQDQTKSLVTATTTRRKQQQEMIRRALQHEEERKRIGRETFPMMTVSVTQLAAVEPSLHHTAEEHEEGDEERQEHGHQVLLAQTFFPSSICTVVLPIIHLLEDGEVSVDGTSVSEVAEKTIWNCLVEDPVLFMRHFLEKLTHKDKHEELLFLLRKLVLYFCDLPSQMAHSLFNYLIGYIMFYVRTPQTYGQEAIAGALALLWQVVPSVEGIYFKDLKQTLKKEQCDPNIMISANVPSAKKIIVHGPDLTSIPSQFPVHEDTQFNVILQDSLDFFNIPDDEHGSYFLVDTKSNQIHNMNSYVRDFYFFRRNFYPQLSLVHMDPEEAQDNLQKQAFFLKFGEIGKVLFTVSVLDSTSPHQLQNHIAFLHEELIKLPAFPRKALDAEFSLYNGSLGKELYGMDTLHKFTWIKLMDTIFTQMTSSFNWTQDLCLFLNVINGCIILHCEDAVMLRCCLATIMNTSIHFKHIFSMNGFLYVMPTLMRTYSNHQPNPLLCRTIELVCRQFYLLHRKPFLLQLFGSVSQILDLQSVSTGMKDTTKVQPECLFNLLLSLEKDSPDILSLLDIINGTKPFKALDFCYENDPDTFNLVDVINLCVTVVVYASDSFRSVQMLTMLMVVLPRYLHHLKMETNKKDNPPAARAEINGINTIAVSMRALITSCDFFARSMSVPIRQLEADKSSMKDKSRSSPVETSVFYDEREDQAAGRHMEEGRGRKNLHYDQDDEDEQMRNDFRKPRDSLLNVVAEFYSTCQPRLKELRKMLADPSFRPPELLDHKSHNRLAEIGHTLLKLAPYDPETMACAGLQRYMTEILPITDWSQEPVRPALNLILRRLDRLFSKISKKSNLKKKCDWHAAANLLKGVYFTLKKFPFIAHLPHLKTLTNVLITIILSPGSQTMMENLPGMGAFRSEHGTTIPPLFSSEVVKLVAMQMQALGENFSLEQICGGMAVFPTNERCVNMLVNFILPLCIRVGCGRRDTPKLRQTDISFALQIVLNVLNPPVKTPPGSQNSSTKSGMHHLSISETGRCSSVGNSHKNNVKLQGNELLIHTAYLGLEILMTCFDKPLAPEWHRVAKCVMQISQCWVCLPLWNFLDFVVTHRPSIFLMLQPFIQFKMMRVNCDTAQEYYIQQTIKDKLLGYSFAHPKCKGSVLVELALELKQIKDEFISTGGEYRSRSTTMATERSDFSQLLDIRSKMGISEMTAEIIGPPRPTLATIGKRASKATILSQSSNASATFKATSFDSGSPNGRRMSGGRRILAKDGTRILEKFKKPTQDDISPSAEQPVTESPVLPDRVPSIVLRATLSIQNSVDEQSPAADVQYENELEVTEGKPVDLDMNPREHRLQRQDAKSRKTFKMKRTKTKPTSLRRLVPHRGHNETSDIESNSTDGSLSNSTALSHRRTIDNGALKLQRTGMGTQTPLSGSHANVTNIAQSVETISEAVNSNKKSSRPRYIQRSKSHDDPHADTHAPAGTVRGRIARQGAKMVRSRSPSSSPVRSPKYSGPMSPPPPMNSGCDDHSGELPVHVTYAAMPAAGSPPESAQSVEGGKSMFRYSLKRKEPFVSYCVPKPMSPVSSPTSPDVSSPCNIASPPTGHISPSTFGIPKPVVPLPEKKITSPKSTVLSHIQRFSMLDEMRDKHFSPNKDQAAQKSVPEKIIPLAPPPIPHRQMWTSASETQAKNQFKSRDRQRPFSPPEKQRAISKLLQDHAANQQLTLQSYDIAPEIHDNLKRKVMDPFDLSFGSPEKKTSWENTTKNKDHIKQAYISRCSSDESLTECSSLLKEDEKSSSQSSVCVYFDGKGIPDTLV